MKRPRPQLTVKELIDFISKYPDDTLVYSAPSEINIDEPIETQEYIFEEESVPVVAISYSVIHEITIGFIKE